MGKRSHKEEPELEPRADEIPVSATVVGAAAHDPLVHRSRGLPSLLSARTWLASQKLRPVDTAAFASWASRKHPGETTALCWAALLAEFKTTVIK